jgi:hypothetical protein
VIDFDAETLVHISIILVITVISSFSNKTAGIVVSGVISVVSFLLGFLFIFGGGWMLLLNAFIIWPSTAWLGFGIGRFLCKLLNKSGNVPEGDDEAAYEHMRKNNTGVKFEGDGRE